MAISINTETLNSLQTVRTPELAELWGQAHPDRTKILAEGDSWFAYPRSLIWIGEDANVVDHLKNRDNLAITNVSSNGDEAVAMVSGDKKLDLLKRINGNHYDILLFSGGGNDIVGRYDFGFFLKDYVGGQSPKELIHWDRLERRLSMIESAYSDLVDLVKLHSKNREIKIVSHSYDLAPPSSQGAEFFWGLLEIDNGRSWMNPYFNVAGFPKDSDLRKKMVALILGRFQERLRELQLTYPDRFFLVETQGTLNDSEWLNEIHPDSNGFSKIAEKIYREGIEPLI